MRKASMTFEAIGERLGITRVGASKAVRRALAAHLELTRASAEELRGLELARLDALQAAWWSRALDGDVGAGRLVLRAMEQRSRLLGLEARDPLVTTVRFGDRLIPAEYTPLEPEKVALAKALLEIEPRKRAMLMTAVDAGEDPREVLERLVIDAETAEGDRRGPTGRRGPPR